MHVVIKYINRMLQVLYPRCCPVCHEIVMPKGEWICPSCVGKLTRVTEPKCKKCGKPIASDTKEFCSDCQKYDHFFDAGMGMFVYDRQMKESISYYKQRGRREYGDFYGQAAGILAKAAMEYWRPQAIVPVPLHPSRQRRRGFNQAEYFAGHLARLYSIPVRTDWVIRCRDTRQQKSLDHKARARNLARAFQKGTGEILAQRVLIVDDVYTTGNTIDAVAKILRKSGVKYIYFLTISIGKGF